MLSINYRFIFSKGFSEVELKFRTPPLVSCNTDGNVAGVVIDRHDDGTGSLTYIRC